MRPWVLLVIILASAGFAVFLVTATARHEDTTATTSSRDPRGAGARRPEDATYRIDDRDVTFMNGTATVADPTATYVLTEVAYRADVDRSGTEDAVVIVERDRGGDGVSSYIAVALRDGDEYLGTNALFLGDGIARISTGFEKWQIVQRYYVRVPGASVESPPTLDIVTRYVIDKTGALALVPDENRPGKTR